MSATLSHFVDGQTRPFYLAAEPQIHPALTGEFRPQTYEQCERIDLTLRQLGGNDEQSTNKRATAIIGVIARQLVSWDAGQDPTPENVRKLHPRLINLLFAIVCGRFGGDAPPTQSQPGDYDEFTRDLLAAGGDNVGLTRQEAVAKN